ncbi:MAG: MarR family transcriptional regulator [Clostridiales bacterium]|nr:MarR family transcriptional regulator [Clostridiales bacterium]
MAQEYPQLLLNNQLCFPLYACSRKIVGSYTPFLKPLGLTYTQYLVLMVLWEHESMSVGQLGNILYLDAGTLTPLLKRLEKAGYVTRERSKDDERITIISITEAGNQLKEQCKDIPSKISAGSSALTREEAGELYRMLYVFLKEE